jgi:hypothetical protein
MTNTIRIRGLENKDLKVVKAPPRPAPPTFPDKAFIGSIVGSRGSGKTNAMINLVFHYEKTKYFDKIYMFSPTSFGNDPKYDLLEQGQHHYEYKKYPTYTDEIFKEVLDEIKRDVKEFEEWQRLHKIYQKFMKYGYKRLTPEEILEVDLMMNSEEEIDEPTCRFEKMPTSLLIFDDLVSNTELYKNTPRGIFYNFAILHRHLLCSLLFVVQTWSGAVPKQIRANLSLVMLFDLKPEIKKQVADEMCANMNEEAFIRMWEEACINSYDFFMINFDAPKKFKFRRNFDEIFLLEDFKKKNEETSKSGGGEIQREP